MNRIHNQSTLIVVLCLFLTASASANTASWTNAPVPLGTHIVDGFTLPFGPSGQVIGNLDGYIVNDLILSTTSDWTAAALLIELHSGSIWQEPDDTVAAFFNGKTLGQPTPGFFVVLPSSEYDTRIFDPHGSASILGAAGDVGGDVEQFDTAEIDISWNSTGADTADIGTFSIGRFTLSPDAGGVATIAFTVAGVDRAIVRTQVVVNGILFPEPASLVLLGLGGLGLVRRRSCRGGKI